MARSRPCQRTFHFPAALAVWALFIIVSAALLSSSAGSPFFGAGSVGAILRSSSQRTADGAGVITPPAAIKSGLPAAPYAPDQYTALLLHADGSAAGASAAGQVDPLKSTELFVGGVFGGALQGGAGTVGIYPVPTVPNRGTLEAWIKPAASAAGQTIFSLRGVRPLVSGAHNSLLFGESQLSGDPATSFIYPGGPAGLSEANRISLPSDFLRGSAIDDLNGDGARDLIVAEHPRDRLAVYYGPFPPGVSREAPDATLSIPKPQGLALLDADQDGRPDALAAASYDAATPPFLVWRINPDGTFTVGSPNFAGGTLSAEGLMVVNEGSDSIPDVIAVSFDPAKPVTLFRGSLDQSGSWTVDVTKPDSFQLFADAAPSLGGVVADLNGDGLTDFATAQVFSNRALVYLRNPDRTFPPAASYAISTPGPFTLAAHDVNNDGYMDLAAANYLNSQGALRAYLGPDLDQNPPVLHFPASDPVSLTFGDLNGDGIADLVSHSSVGTLSYAHFLGVDGDVLSTQTLDSQPSKGNGGGPGLTVHATGGGTPYATDLNQDNDVSVSVDPAGTQAAFTVFDDSGKAHSVSAPLAGQDAVNGFVHVYAEWDFRAGMLRLVVGKPQNAANVYSYSAGAPIAFGATDPVLRILTDTDNQHPFAGAADEVRYSTGTFRSGLKLTGGPAQ